MQEPLSSEFAVNGEGPSSVVGGFCGRHATEAGTKKSGWQTESDTAVVREIHVTHEWTGQDLRIVVGRGGFAFERSAKCGEGSIAREKEPSRNGAMRPQLRQ